jgi:hypothetical protein
MVSTGLTIPRTRFPSVEPTWEYTPLSHESGAICTWEAGESGRGAIAIGSAMSYVRSYADGIAPGWNFGPNLHLDGPADLLT